LTKHVADLNAALRPVDHDLPIRLRKFLPFPAAVRTAVRIFIFERCSRRYLHHKSIDGIVRDLIPLGIIIIHPHGIRFPIPNEFVIPDDIDPFADEDLLRIAFEDDRNGILLALRHRSAGRLRYLRIMSGNDRIEFTLREGSSRLLAEGIQIP
jgi:hypothetical protein